MQCTCAVLCHLWPVCIILHYLINGKIFQKKINEHKICVLISSTNLSETFLILRRSERDMITNVYRSLCKISAFLVIILKNLNFLDRFSKTAQISIESFH
jgi:hypothetical protein